MMKIRMEKLLAGFSDYVADIEKSNGCPLDLKTVRRLSRKYVLEYYGLDKVAKSLMRRWYMQNTKEGGAQ